MELCIKSRREKQTTISEVVVRGKRNIKPLSKIGIGFSSNFLSKARVLNLTISKRKNLRLPLKVETDQFVVCLALQECLTVSEANRDSADA